MSERVLVRKIEENLWQWREVTSQGEWCAEAYYTGDINLLKETVQGKLVWLILPGQSVVAQHAVADIKDRAQLLKILPYELEDNVVDPIEEMHFSYGDISDGIIPVAYGELEWFRQCIEEVEALEAEVLLCSADYLQLPRDDSTWTVLLESGTVMALTHKGQGFAIEQSMAGLYFNALSNGDLPQSIRLYGDSAESLQVLKQLLPKSVTTQDDLVITEQEAGLWDIISSSESLRVNFRSGALARQLPFAKWWSDYKVPIVAMAAAFVLALTTMWMEQSKLTSERKTILSQTDEIYRQVVPKGKITEPIRQLKVLLGNSGTSSAKPSTAVALITGVGPAINAVKAIHIKSFRYSVSKGQLQMRVEGSSYEDFEALRGKIAEVGLEADIKNQSAHGDVFEAQIRVSEAG